MKSHSTRRQSHQGNHRPTHLLSTTAVLASTTMTTSRRPAVLGQGEAAHQQGRGWTQRSKARHVSCLTTIPDAADVPRSERNGDDYSLLPHEADPEPEDLPPLMTWGTLLATPRALDGSGDPLDLSGPTFRMPETKHRDDIGRRLGSKAGKSMRDRAAAHSPRPGSSSLSSVLRSKTGDKSIRGSMGPPSTPQRQGNLTPAAKSLLDRSLGRTPQRSGLGFGSGGGVRGSGFGKTGHGAKSWDQSPAPGR